MVEVGEFRDVTLHTDDVLSELLYGGIEFGLPSSGDEDEGSFGNELLCGGEANAAAAAGDDSDFIFALLLMAFLFLFPFALLFCYERAFRLGLRKGRH